LAEGMGFEPTIGFNPYNGLANRHPSECNWLHNSYFYIESIGYYPP